MSSLPHEPSEDSPERTEVHRVTTFDPFVRIPGHADQF